MNNPLWVKDYMQNQKPQIRDQVTILRRPIQRPSFTGTNPDGSVNQNKPVAVGSTEMHQGEGVIPAHIMTGPVGKDIAGFIKDKTGWDMMKQPIQKEGNTLKMATGGVTGNTAAGDYQEGGKWFNKGGVALAGQGDMTATQSQVDTTRAAGDAAAQSSLNAAQNISTLDKNKKAGDYWEGGKLFNQGGMAYGGQGPVTATTAQVNAQRAAGDAAAQQSIDAARAISTAKPVQAPAPVANQTSTVVTNAAMNRENQVAQGNSPIMANIQKNAFTNLGSQLATQMTDTTMQIAQNQNLTAGAKRAALGEALRNAGVQESSLASQMANQAMTIAEQANQNAFNMATQNRTFDTTQKSNALSLALQSGDFTAAGKIASELYGSTVDMSQLKTNADRTNYNNALSQIDTELETNQFTSATDALANGQVQSSLDAAWNALPESARAGQSEDAWKKTTMDNLMTARNPITRVMNNLGGQQTLQSIYPNLQGDANWNKFKGLLASAITTGGISIGTDGNISWDHTNAQSAALSAFMNPTAKTPAQVADLQANWGDATKYTGTGDVRYDISGKQYVDKDGKQMTASDYLKTLPSTSAGDIKTTPDGDQYQKNSTGGWDKMGDTPTAYQAEQTAKFDNVIGPNGDLFGTDATNFDKTGTPEQKAQLSDARVKAATDGINGATPDYSAYKKLSPADQAKVASGLTPLEVTNTIPEDGTYSIGGSMVKVTNTGGTYKLSDPITGKNTTITGGQKLTMPGGGSLSISKSGDIDYKNGRIRITDGNKNYMISMQDWNKLMAAWVSGHPIYPTLDTSGGGDNTATVD